MIASFGSALTRARASGQAVPAFSCYDLETAGAVLRSVGTGRSVVLLLPAQILEDDIAVAAFRAAAAYAPARVCLQADHLHDLQSIERACRLGVCSVMADAAELPFEENVAFVRAAGQIARSHGAGIEAEVGRLPGGADADAPFGPGLLTDPAEAAEFVARTEIDCLAVAVGNVHGMLLDTPVTLDWARLAAIRRRVRVPLALHGGSGLDPALLSDAVCAGITKVNINTALRRAYLDATRDALAQTDALADLAAMHERQAAAIEAAATATLTALAAVHTTAGAHAWAG
jgi:fructose-bisphosphate aldolase class II/tagatose 1,6-diphosphate aldolase GatY/KbaY